MDSDVTQPDGTLDWSGGVDSLKCPTTSSPQVPNGLSRNQLAWGINLGMRDGALSPRDGWTQNGIITLPGPFVIPGTPPVQTPASQYLTITTNNWTFPHTVGTSVTVNTASEYIGNTGDIQIVTAENGTYFGFFTVTGYTSGTITLQLYQPFPSYTNPVPANISFLFQLYQQGGTVGPSTDVPAATPWFQGSKVYVPTNGQKPYIIALIGGHVIQIDPDFQYAPIDLSAQFNLFHPANTPRGYFEQAENYLVIQAGDYDPVNNTGTLPLFWSGSVLTRSNGLTGTLSVGQANANVYNLTSTAGWTIPAVGGTVYVSTTGQYGGNYGDLVEVILTSGPTNEGNFKVTSIGTNTIGLQNVTGTPGATVASGAMTLTNVLPAAQTVNIFQNTFPTVTGGNPPNGVPAAGHSVTISFQGGAYRYPGAIGDTIYYWRNNVFYGSFQVTGFTNGTLALLSVAPQHVGSTFGGGTTTWLAVNDLLAPAAGASVAIPILGGYNGSIGDQVTITDSNNNTWGTYTVISQSGGPLWQLGVVFQAIAPNPTYVGQVFPLTFTITPYQAASSTGTLINQIPAATCMLYYMGRLWYAIGDTVAAGDIVGSLSGTAANKYIDSVLSVRQNELAFGGGGFTMPLNPGPITGLASPQMINASLGQGLLMIGTLNALFSLQVPVSASDWVAANAANPPQINVVQFNNGWVNDWSIVSVNGDLYFQTQEPGIRSFITAVRYFQQYGGVDISSNEERILDFVNTSLLNFASGIYFDNYLMMTTLPMLTPYGTIHQAIIPLDMTPISTLEEQLPPNWLGSWEGLQILQLLQGSFNGVQRGFIVSLSKLVPGQFELWEIKPGNAFENQGLANEARIQWQGELPAFTWNEEFELKNLVSAELWFDQIQGDVEVLVEWRPDSSTCWLPWIKFQLCSARNSAENAQNPISYPLTPYPPGYKQCLSLPKPPDISNGVTGRPSNLAYQIQPRITILGQARLRGFILYATAHKKRVYAAMVSAMVQP